ncbi:MAG: GntR family transcriptional regulator [Spirochaetales bacterium]|nr:GntR family transcriptional regulator [Spirochaetales bacterium]
MTKKEKAFEDLKDRIVSGEIAPGSWLTEREISTKYNLSRTPIREILWNLANLNIVEAVGDRGYRVVKYSINDIIEVFNARKAIEGECARLACLSTDQDYSSRIEELRKELMKAKDDEDPVRMVEVGSSVHRFIQEKANNRYLSAFNTRIYSLVAIIRNTTKSYLAIEKESWIGHRDILDALAERDSMKCARTMRAHLQSTCVAFVKLGCNNLLGVDVQDMIFLEGDDL